MRPIVPILIKSSGFSPFVSNFLTICATRRKLCSISLFRETSSPCSIFSKQSFSSASDNGSGKTLFE